jgi:hypothetical protein
MGSEASRKVCSPVRALTNLYAICRSFSAHFDPLLREVGDARSKVSR